jgi:hypothetical protein
MNHVTSISSLHRSAIGLKQLCILPIICLLGCQSAFAEREFKEWGQSSSERQSPFPLPSSESGQRPGGSEWGQSSSEWGQSPSGAEWGQSSSGGEWGQAPVQQPVAGAPYAGDGIEYKLNPGSMSADERTTMNKIGIQREPRLSIMDFVNKLPPAGGAPSLKDAQLGYVKTEALEKLFPEWMFYVLRFPQYPVKLSPPDGLATSNIFIAKKSGRMSLIASAEELQAFFQQTQSADTDSRARSLVSAWLDLVTELIQDGMYRFSINDASIAVSTRGDDMVASGTASVTKETGNSGDVFVTLIFDNAGKLKGVEEKNTVQPGRRPIAQAQAPVTE